MVTSLPNSAVYSDDPIALERLESICPWHPRILTQIFDRQEHLSGRVVRVYTDGVFDLFHHGHAEQLRQIKQLIPNSYIIAGVVNDEDTRIYKRGSTVMSTRERSDILIHCRYVDEVNRNAPFYPTEEFVDSLKVDLVAHDCIPYPVNSEINDCYLPFKKADRFLETQRTPGISTTSIIQRVLDNFECYKQRQAARLNG